MSQPQVDPAQHVPVIHFVAPVRPPSEYGGCGGLGCSCGFRPSEPGHGWDELDAHRVEVGLKPTNGWFPGTKYGPELSETFREEKRAWQEIAYPGGVGLVELGS